MNRGNRTESLWEGNLPLRGSLRGRGFQRFLEVVRGFQAFRDFSEVFRGPLRDPLRGRFPSQRLSVLLHLIVLPLQLSPTQVIQGKFMKCFGYSFGSRANIGHKHKEAHRTSPISDPTLKFFMWGPLFLKNQGEGATHIKKLLLHWGPLLSLCGYFFMCFFRFLLVAPRIK